MNKIIYEEDIANPILNNILDGIKIGNSKKHSKDFSPLIDIIIKNAQSQVQTRLGDWKSYQYLGFLNRETETVVLWKGRFNKTDNDVLIKMVISKKNGNYLVVDLSFQ